MENLVVTDGDIDCLKNTEWKYLQKYWVGSYNLKLTDLISYHITLTTT